MSAVADSPNNFYVGLGYGVASISTPVLLGDNLDSSESLSADIDTESSGAVIYGGYYLHENFSIELEYDRYGKFRSDIKDASGAIVGDYWITISSLSAFMRASVRIPYAEKFLVYARLGIARLKIEDGPTPDEQGYTYGLAVGLPSIEYQATDKLFIRLDITNTMFSTSYTYDPRTDPQYLGTSSKQRISDPNWIEKLSVSVGYMF